MHRYSAQYVEEATICIHLVAPPKWNKLYIQIHSRFFIFIFPTTLKFQDELMLLENSSVFIAIDTFQAYAVWHRVKFEETESKIKVKRRKIEAQCERSSFSLYINRVRGNCFVPHQIHLELRHAARRTKITITYHYVARWKNNCLHCWISVVQYFVLF